MPTMKKILACVAVVGALVTGVVGYNTATATRYSPGLVIATNPVRVAAYSAGAGAITAVAAPDGPMTFNDASCVKAAYVNITVVGQGAAGYLTAWDGNGTPYTGVSNLNVTGTGDVDSNLVLVSTLALPYPSATPGTWAPWFKIYTSSAMFIYVDLFGYVKC